MIGTIEVNKVILQSHKSHMAGFKDGGILLFLD